MAARIDRWLLALALLAACKTRGRAESPDLQGDDFFDVERALAVSETDLRDAGIVVAYRAPSNHDIAGADFGVPPTTTTVPEHVTPEPTPEPEEPIAAEPVQPSESEERDAPREATITAPARERRRSSLADWIAGRRAARAARTRCERVCDLAAATCDLRDRICNLAGDHPDDTRYADACTRADDQCTAAKSYCDGCAA